MLSVSGRVILSDRRGDNRLYKVARSARARHQNGHAALSCVILSLDKVRYPGLTSSQCTCHPRRNKMSAVTACNKYDNDTFFWLQDGDSREMLKCGGNVIVLRAIVCNV